MKNTRFLPSSCLYGPGAISSCVEHTPPPSGRINYSSALIVFILLVSLAFNANANCNTASLEDHRSSTGYDVPITVVFLQNSPLKSEEIIKRFEKALSSIDPGILDIVARARVLSFSEETAAEQINLLSLKPGLLVVVDSEFMEGGKPKYNDLLISYRDSVIRDDQILVLDPWPIAQQVKKTDRAFIQVSSATLPEFLPFVLELAAYLWHDPTLFKVPEFLNYAARVTDEVAGGNPLTSEALKERKLLISDCLGNRF